MLGQCCGRILLGDTESRVLRPVPVADPYCSQARCRRLDRAGLQPAQTPLGPRYDQPSRIREKIHSIGTSRLTLCLPNGVKPSETRLAVGIWRLGIAGRLLPLTTLGAWHCRKGADLVTLGTRSPRGPQRPDHASTPVLSPASSRSRPARPRPVADDASGIDSPASAAKDQARRT